MLSYINRVVRAMLVSSLGVGGGIGLLVMIIVLTNRSEPNAFKWGLTVGLLLGGIFAAFTLAVLLPLDLSAHIFLSKGRYKSIWELDQVRELEVQGTVKQILHACRQALLVVPYVTTVSDDVENMITRAFTSVSWRSGGEEMEVEITPVSINNWTVKISSRPRSKNVLFDYAKNFENVETFTTQFIDLLGVDNVKVCTAGESSKEKVVDSASKPSGKESS